MAANRSLFNRTHPVAGTPTQKLIYAGAVQNNTAAGADLWLPMKPGTDMALLLGIAHLVIKAGKTGFAAGLGNFASFAAAYTPEKVSGITGVPVARLEAAAKAVVEAERPLVIAGSALGSGGGAGPVMAAVAINMLLGSVNRKGGLLDLPFPRVRHPPTPPTTAKPCASASWTTPRPWPQTRSGSRAPARVRRQSALRLPADSGIGATIKKAGFSVAVASFMSETCEACDLVLPAASAWKPSTTCRPPTVPAA